MFELFKLAWDFVVLRDASKKGQMQLARMGVWIWFRPARVQHRATCGTALRKASAVQTTLHRRHGSCLNQFCYLHVVVFPLVAAPK